ncbi:MAG: molybdopterin-synthase adenylyltransferase MoeB [Planctomycetota bacterium]
MRPDQYRRYSRHLILPEVGLEGQKKLLNAKVLLIGAGGLGCPTALYLAAAGVGTLGIIDFDRVDESNLQRQVLFTTADVGKFKAEVAKQRLVALNPDVTVVVYALPLSSENSMEIFRDYDIVIDGTDNFATRYLVNDTCVLLKKPNIYGSIFRFDGQASLFVPFEGPCYRCLYPEPPPPEMAPSCAEGGVLGILPGFISMIQATECVKWILGRAGKSLMGRLLQYDAFEMTLRELKIRRDKNCPICGDHPTITKLIDYLEFCNVRGEDLPDFAKAAGAEQKPAAQPAGAIGSMQVTELAKALEAAENFVLLDVRMPGEWEICHLPQAKLLPLGELAQRVDELADLKDKKLVVMCKMGGRSMRACQFLQQQGFTHLYNVVGGIAKWADEVEPDMPRY